MTTLLYYVINRLDAIDISRQTIRYILLVFVLGFAGSLPIRAQSSNVVLNGVTITTGFTLNWSETLLILSESSTIALGTGNHSLTFAASNSVTWTGTTLMVTGWTGTAGASGTGGKIFVGNSTSGLTSGQLAKISFAGYSGTATILSTGEVVPEGAGPTASVLSNGTGNSTICAGGTANIKVTITGGASPYMVVYSDGTNNFNVNNYISETNITVSPVSTTTYTLVSVMDNNSLPGANNSGSAVVTTTSTVVPASVGTYTATVNHTDGATLNYIDGSCNLLARIEDEVGGNVLGSTTVSGELLSTVPSNINTAYYYAPRYYTITPAVNGAASVTLYYLQSDFDSYNSGNSYQVDMPVSGSNGDPNISNIRIAHIVGSLSSGTITTYSSPVVNWNSGSGIWEVTVDIPNASGSYYLYTPFSCSLSIDYSSLQVNTITAQSANVSWTPVSGALDYRIRIRPQGTNTWNASTNSGSARVYNGLQPNTTYEVQVRVRCSVIEQGEYSNTRTFSTLSNPCVAPTGLAANSITSHSVILNWNLVNEGISYFIQVRQVGNNWGGGSTVFTNTKSITGLQANTNYEARVYTNCSGTPSSGFSSSIFFTTLTASCIPPSGLTSTNITNTSVSITWDAVGSGNSYFIQIRRVGNNWGGGSTISGTSRTYTGLIPGTEYETRVYTNCNGSPSSVFSGSHFFSTTGTPCLEPTSLMASNITTNSVQLNWSNTNASSYSIRVRVAGTNWGGNTSSTTNSKTITGLMSSTNYEYQVIGFCSGVVSLWSEVGTFSTLALGLNEVIVESRSNQNQVSVSMYPNPTNDVLFLTFKSKQIIETMIFIMDISGKIIKEINHTTIEGNNIIQVNLGDLVQGVYMLQVSSVNGWLYTGRVVKTQ